MRAILEAVPGARRARGTAWWDSGVGDVGGGGGDLAQGAMDVGGQDLGGGFARGGEPCGLGEEVECSGVSLAGLGEQVDGGGIEDVALQAGATDLPVEVCGDLVAFEGGEHGGGTDAREEGALHRQAQAAKEVFVAGEHEGKGAAREKGVSQKKLTSPSASGKVRHG